MKTKGTSGKTKESRAGSIKKLSAGATLLGITLGVNIGDAHALNLPSINGFNPDSYFQFNELKEHLGYSSIKIDGFSSHKIASPTFNFHKIIPSNQALFSPITLPVDADSLSLDFFVGNYNSGDVMSIFWEERRLQTFDLASFDPRHWYALEGIPLGNVAEKEGYLTFVLESQSTSADSQVEIANVMINGSGSSVPLPGTLLLTASGVAGLPAIRRRFKK